MLRNLSKLFSNVIYSNKNVFSQVVLPNVNLSINPFPFSKKIHTTTAVKDLMEFFDDKKNWGENEIKVGRAWYLDELRIKSNVDLHKLWYVLLKEKNMLLTMEHECKDKMELFPNPERLDKVNISMENLENVVRERNKAYHELETGEKGERPGRIVSTVFGTNFYYKEFEHVVPKFVNSKWLKTHKFSPNSKAAKKFMLLYREKLYNEKRKAKNRRRNEVMMLLRRNPSLDKNLLQQKFPGVNISKLLRDDKTKGHYVPEIEKK